MIVRGSPAGHKSSFFLRNLLPSVALYTSSFMRIILGAEPVFFVSVLVASLFWLLIADVFDVVGGLVSLLEELGIWV
jgi:ABC-type multidrug transport system permease subunit